MNRASATVAGRGRALASRLMTTNAAVVFAGLAAGLLITTAGVGVGLGIWAAVALFLVTLRSIEAALILLISIMMMFNRVELFAYDIPFGGGGLKISDALLGTIMVGWFVRIVVMGEKSRKLPVLFCCLVVLFVLVSSVSAVNAVLNGINYKDALLELRPLLQYLLVFPIIAEYDSHKLKRTIVCILGVSVLSSIRIFYLYATGVGEVLLYAEGIRIVVLELGAYLPPVLLGFTLFLYRRRPKAHLAVALINLSAMALTFFRSAWLGLTGGMAFLFLTCEMRMKRSMVILVLWLLLGGVVASVAFAVLRPKGVNPLESVVTRLLSLREFSEDISSLHRLREWEASLELIDTSPLWGHGLGSRVVFESPMYDMEAMALGYQSHDTYMHNSYMWMLVKMGFAGLLSFLAVVAAALYTAVTAAYRTEDPMDRAYLLGLGSCLAGNMVISIFGPMFNIDNMTPIVSFVMSGIFVMAREAQNPWDVEL